MATPFIPVWLAPRHSASVPARADAGAASRRAMTAPVSRNDAPYSATRTGSATRDVPTDTATIRAPATRYPDPSPW